MGLDTNSLRELANSFISRADAFEASQVVLMATKEQLENSIKDTVQDTKRAQSDLDIATNALMILRKISDEAVYQSYKFIESSINSALERIFDKTHRQIRLKETTRGGIHPQLEIELIVENNVVRSLKDDSGHGIMQVISLLCILTLIVITGGRRLLVIDEVLSGVSATSRQIIDDIIWSFVDIGFQFIVSEHGYVPRGSKVYELEMVAGVSSIKREYIANEGVYLDKPVVSKHVLSRIGNIEDMSGSAGNETIDTMGVEAQSSSVITSNVVHNGEIIDI